MKSSRPPRSGAPPAGTPSSDGAARQRPPRPDPPPPPKRGPNLPLVFRVRDRIVHEALFGLWHLELKGDVLVDAADAIHRELKGLGVPLAAVADSLLPHAGSELTGEVGRGLAWRLAANLDALRDGRCVPPWSGQAAPEWVPMQITAAVPERLRSGVVGHRFRLKCLAGTPAGVDTTVFWRFSRLQSMSSRFGFANGFRARPRLPLTRADQFVRLRFYGHVEPALSVESPRFSFVHVSSTFHAWNTRILKVRLRAQPCPRKHPFECHACPVGSLGEDGCEAAVHALPWEYRACPACGAEGAAFDPDLGRDKCVRCVRDSIIPKEGD